MIPIERHHLNALRGRLIELRKRAEEEKDETGLYQELSGMESVLEAVMEGNLSYLHSYLDGEENRLDTGMCTG